MIGRMRLVVVTAAVVAGTVTTGACGGGSHRTQVAPPESLSRLTLRSSAFRDQGPIPARYTCDGDEKPPPLTWSAPPAGTTELTLTVEDPDAPKPPFIHWPTTAYRAF